MQTRYRRGIAGVWLILWFVLFLSGSVHAGQLGAGAGTSYPAAIDTNSVKTNIGGSCNTAISTKVCAEMPNDLQSAILAIESELGLSPKGTFATVLARLNAAVYSGTAGLSSYVAGDLLQASNTTTLARLANVATGNVLLSGGVGVVSAWGKVGLTTHVDGILPTANGGTGIAYFTAAGPTVARVYTFPDSAGSVPLLGVANAFTALQTFSAGLLLGSDDTLAWGNAVGGGTADTFLSRVSAAKLNFGAADSSSPVAQILTFQGYNNAVATAGPLAIIQGSTGGLTSGTGGELRLQGGLSGAAAGTGGAITLYTAPLAAGTTPAARVTVLPSGNVGIGTTNPSTDQLAIKSPAAGSGRQLGIDSPASGYSQFNFLDNGTTLWRLRKDSSNEFDIYSDTLGASVQHFKENGNIGIGTTSPASLLDLRAGDLTQSGANGQKYVLGRATELVAVGSGISTKATTIQIPADAIVDVVSVRVKTQPGGTSTVVVTSTTSGDQFQKGASISTVAGTTDPGTKGTPRNYNSVAAQTVTLTFDTSTTDALGEIRVDLVYRTMTPATS